MKYVVSDEDAERLRLFVWESRILAMRLRRDGNPAAEELERLVNRLAAPTELDRVPAHG